MITACNLHQEKTKKAGAIVIHPDSQLATLYRERNDSIAMAQVEKLSEYKNILKWYDKVNKDTTRHIAVIAMGEPNKSFNCYQIVIGEDTRDHFVEMEHFYVDAKTLAIKHIDIETDSAYTISQWRKGGKDVWMK